MTNYYASLNLANPYDRFRGKAGLKKKIKGWTGERPFFHTIMTDVKPTIIIEVGTFLGQSAINMATIAQNAGLETTIFCIDTWLGSEEHWRDDKCKMMDLFGHFSDGTSALYDQFIKNVLLSGVEERIVPIPNTSVVGRNILRWKGITADLIYIDASHEKEDVKRDITLFWELLNTGGVMFGDDYFSWPAVGEAVREVSTQMNRPLEVMDNHFWVLKKA